MLSLWPDRTISSWRKGLAEIFAIGRFGALFLYLEMPELGAGTQGAGGYCKEAYQWILRNWNAEIPCIIGTPRLISVLSRFPNSGRVGAPTVPGRNGLCLCAHQRRG